MVRTKEVKKEEEDEDIWNVPNTLTLSRIILTFVTVYVILSGYRSLIIVICFAIAAFTDFLDGQIARRFNTVTEFGRKFDMIADRFLMVGTIFALLFVYSSDGLFNRPEILQIFLIMSREIITFPVAAIAAYQRAGVPQARFIGKLTTFMQGVTFPIIILGHDYTFFAAISIYLAVLTAIIGIGSGFTYFKDYYNLIQKRK